MLDWPAASRDPSASLAIDPSHRHTGMPPDATTEVTDRLRAAVADIAAHHPRLRFAYLFGSHATGMATPDSDVDVAVHLGDGPPLTEVADVEQALGHRLGHAVDVLALDRAPLWLQFRVLGEGTLVYSRDEPARVSFREHVEKRFLDFKPLHDAYLGAVRARARAGRLSRG